MEKILLNTGETEILMTNLYDSLLYTKNDLKEVHNLRWGIETAYGIMKNQLQLENFSGIKSNCIEQDYYANIFAYNLQSLIEKQSEQVVEKVNAKRKLNYKINKNLSWASLKNRMVDLFLKEDSLQVLIELQFLFQKYLEPVRLNRHYPRIRKKCMEIENITP